MYQGFLCLQGYAKKNFENDVTMSTDKIYIKKILDHSNGRIIENQKENIVVKIEECWHGEHGGF